MVGGTVQYAEPKPSSWLSACKYYTGLNPRGWIKVSQVCPKSVIVSITKGDYVFKALNLEAPASTIPIINNTVI